MDDAQIKRMVDRFLCWRLPEDFSPDAGISFRPTYNAGTAKFEPVGTNLFSATQAEAMIRHMIAGIPVPSPTPPVPQPTHELSAEWHSECHGRPCISKSYIETVGDRMADALDGQGREIAVLRSANHDISQAQWADLKRREAADLVLGLRKNFAKYLAPLYRADAVAISNLCDDELDRTGALLGYVREASLAQKDNR